MRSKITTAIILVLLCFSLFGQDSKTRAEFFKEFYGTLINSSGLEIPEYKQEAAPTVDLSDVIKQLESRYNIDIPAEEEEKFKTVEDVAEYVNLFLQKQQSDIAEQGETSVVKPLDSPIKLPKKNNEAYSWKFKIYGSYGLTVEPILALAGTSRMERKLRGSAGALKS